MMRRGSLPCFFRRDLERTAMRASTQLFARAPEGALRQAAMRRSRRARYWLAGSLAALGVNVSAGPALAAPTKQSKARTQASLEEVAVMLSSPDEDEVRTALETAATLPPGDIIAMLDDRVRAGLSRVLLDVAIDSLLLLDDPASAPLLIDLAHHRRPEVRVRALEVLGRLKASHSEAMLVRGLSDLSPEVRTAAANALADSGARESMAPLTRALEHGVDAAGRALGRLAKPAEVVPLLAYIEKLPVSQVTPLIEALLARRDVPEADKLLAVQRVSALPGDDASTGLTALLSLLPPDASPRVRKALTEAVAAKGAE
jgi:hypothetical protein